MEARDSWAKESIRRWPWKAVQMHFLPLTSVRPFSLLQIDFLSSLNHVSRTPKPTCVISLLYQSPKDMVILPDSKERTLVSPRWSDFCPSVISCGQRGGSLCTDSCQGSLL